MCCCYVSENVVVVGEPFILAATPRIYENTKKSHFLQFQVFFGVR